MLLSLVVVVVAKRERERDKTTSSSSLLLFRNFKMYVRFSFVRVHHSIVVAWKTRKFSCGSQFLFG